MNAAVTSVDALRDATRSGSSLLSRVTGSTIFVLVVMLLVESLFETWLLVLLADRSIGASGLPELVLPAWPRTIRNGAYIALAIVTVLHIAQAGRVRRFMTPADAAFGALVIALVVAGLAGGSSLQLTFEGVFVYLRAAVLLYAIRALAPTWAMCRPILWVLGGIVVLNAILAVLLAWIGPGGYQALGFVDMTWANLHRAQALQSHPNHLGHVAGLAMLGLLAWIATTGPTGIRWWLVFGLLATALALSQSRESLAGVVAGLAVIAILARGRRKALIGAFGLMVAVTLFAWTAQPENWAELARRLQGVIAAVEVPSGEEIGVSCDPVAQDCGIDGIPRRENRVLFYQQGLDLLLRNPVLGYGVGQFGGAVASQHDPQWNRNPKFGPEGFDMHGLDAQQVDSFWLHLSVETGLVGSIAYLAWYASLLWPSIVATRFGGRGRTTDTPDTESDPDGDAAETSHQAASRREQDEVLGEVRQGPRVLVTTNLWAVAALVFGAMSAVFSPALEDPLFAPLLMAIVGLAWVMRTTPVPATDADPAPAGAALAPT